MAHEPNSANAYLRTKVLTAPPEQLRLMLLDGAIRFATQGREALERRDVEGTYNGVSQCRNIVFELMTSIGADADPQLAERVRALYTYMYTRLLEASTERNASKLTEVIDLLVYERDTWVMFIDRLSAERAGARGAGQAPLAAAGGSVSREAKAGSGLSLSA